MTEYRPAIDHSLLSPSGHMSKRAREAALEREARRIFEGVNLQPRTPQPTEASRLRHYAAELRALADRGMNTRKYRRLADGAEQQAITLENGAE